MINTRGENADLKGREARGETLTQKKTSTLNHNRLQSVTHRQKVRTQSKEGEANRAVLHLEWCPPCPLSRTGPSEPQFSLWSVFTEEALPTVRCTVLHTRKNTNLSGSATHGTRAPAIEGVSNYTQPNVGPNQVPWI